MGKVVLYTFFMYGLSAIISFLVAFIIEGIYFFMKSSKKQV